MHLNIEFKARCKNPERVRELLKREGADYKGRDSQTDVYFNVSNGRLKLRKGNIENNLIGYSRKNLVGPKQSEVHLFKTEPNTSLEEVLTSALGVKVIVNKKRDIYFIENVKFHIDEVQGLGSFVEVEAIDLDGRTGKEKLQQQCDKYKKMLEVEDEDLLAKSYSDLLLEINCQKNN
jgi:adenylate cyclase, class 2